MKNINRRESPRIDIRLRCHVTSPAAWLSNATATENISRNGLLIAWGPAEGRGSLPRLGQILTVEVELPANHGFGPKCIHCQGTVVRVSDPAHATPQVALSVNYMDFRAFDERFAPVHAIEPAVGNWMA
jgi:hypothetical protein